MRSLLEEKAVGVGEPSSHQGAPSVDILGQVILTRLKTQMMHGKLSGCRFSPGLCLSQSSLVATTRNGLEPTHAREWNREGRGDRVLYSCFSITWTADAEEGNLSQSS